MIRRLSVPLTIALSLATAATGAEVTVVGEESIPPFVGVNLDGSEFDSSTLAGDVVLLDFWGVWCPPCIRAFPKLSRLHDDYGDRGFQVVGLTVLSGTADEVAEFLEDYEVTYPIVLVETDVPDSFGVLSYPTYLLVSAEGEVVGEYQTVPSDLYAAVAADLEALLPPAPSAPTGSP